MVELSPAAVKACGCTRAVQETLAWGESLVQEQDLDAVKFWTCIAAVASERAGLVRETPMPPRGAGPRLTAMTNAETDAFATVACPFNKHRGEPVRQVPLDYLDWIVGSEMAIFILNCIRYLANPVIAGELERQRSRGRWRDDG